MGCGRPLRPVSIITGTARILAQLDLACVVIRRVVAAEVPTFVNRASDLVFGLARHAAGDAEEVASHN